MNFGNQQQFVEVYSIDGKLILQDFTNQLNLEKYNTGLYYLVIKDKEGNKLFFENLLKE